jgi:hypothetical protein
MAPQEHQYLLAILLGFATGVIARFCMLRSDYRNYPSYPHGYIIHLSLGAIASILAALAVPALIEEELTAVTFLVLCAQQFRDIRSMERETLMKLEEQALVPRGPDYIEGIAKVFESRNYLVMLVALTVSGAVVLSNWRIGCIVAVIMVGFSLCCMRGSYIGDIAQIHAGTLHFDKSLLYVDDIVLMNVGDPKAREKILQEGVGIVLYPNDDDGRAILNSLGQRQAILHDVSILTGNQLDVGEQEWTPMARKNMKTGALGIFILPNYKNVECVIAAVKRTPILESAAQKPLSSAIGRNIAKGAKQHE